MFFDWNNEGLEQQFTQNEIAVVCRMNVVEPEAILSIEATAVLRYAHVHVVTERRILKHSGRHDLSLASLCK